ncbi:hypothetical protein AAMO2058_000292600 [Amorphochlora amoebiformis]
MEKLPRTIEAYDVSHCQGYGVVASCVVIRDGVPRTNEYRCFRISGRAANPMHSDDCASMKEALVTRFSQHRGSRVCVDTLPDLILIDGGKPQLQAALSALRSTGLEDQISVVALAKREELLFTKHTKSPINTGGREDAAVLLCRLARDEAHAMALLSHRTLRYQQYIASHLDGADLKIEDRKRLMKAYSNIEALLTTNHSEISSKIGVSLKTAEKILKNVRESLLSTPATRGRARTGKGVAGVEERVRMYSTAQAALMTASYGALSSRRFNLEEEEGSWDDRLRRMALKGAEMANVFLPPKERKDTKRINASSGTQSDALQRDNLTNVEERYRSNYSSGELPALVGMRAKSWWQNDIGLSKFTLMTDNSTSILPTLSLLSQILPSSPSLPPPASPFLSLLPSDANLSSSTPTKQPPKKRPRRQAKSDDMTPNAKPREDIPEGFDSGEALLEKILKSSGGMSGYGYRPPVKRGGYQGGTLVPGGGGRGFKVVAPFEPTVGQMEAIDRITSLLGQEKQRFAVLKGATGTGKTFIMAHLMARINKPTLLLAPNKVLAAQLFNELKEIFPENRVEYFVSYYDYYRPESYKPVGDVYNDKVAKINQQIDRMRHSATRSLVERRDTVVVSSVSCIYGLGMPSEYISHALPLSRNRTVSLDRLQAHLLSVQYKPAPSPPYVLERGEFRFVRVGGTRDSPETTADFRGPRIPAIPDADELEGRRGVDLEVWATYETRAIILHFEPLTHGPNCPHLVNSQTLHEVNVTAFFNPQPPQNSLSPLNSHQVFTEPTHRLTSITIAAEKLENSSENLKNNTMKGEDVGEETGHAYVLSQGGEEKGRGEREREDFVVYPASHHIVTGKRKEAILKGIRDELNQRTKELVEMGKEQEAKRLAFRTEANLESIERLGYCKGVENYARHLAGRGPGDPSETLLDYFPRSGEWVMMVDESHVSLPQIRGMFRGDVKRKMSLVRHGFRLPSALDNRPLQEYEFWSRVPQALLVSATPGALEYHLARPSIPQDVTRVRVTVGSSVRVELDSHWKLAKVLSATNTSIRVRNGRTLATIPINSPKVLLQTEEGGLPGGGKGVVELLTRPTGILDPEVIVRPTKAQMDDLLAEIFSRISRGERALVVALTRVMAERLSAFLNHRGVKAIWMHCDVKPIQRLRILAALRRGVFDCVVGVNLLREGLDLPEVSFVAIMDADKEGFLRSEQSLIQIIGRAARHVNGTVVMYADAITGSMTAAMKETGRRRRIQESANRKLGHVPKPLLKKASRNVLLDTLNEKDEGKQTKDEKDDGKQTKHSENFRDISKGPRSSGAKLYGFKDREAAQRTIKHVEENKPERSRSVIISMVLRRAVKHPHPKPGHQDAIELYQAYLDLRRSKREAAAIESKERKRGEVKRRREEAKEKRETARALREESRRSAREKRQKEREARQVERETQQLQRKAARASRLLQRQMIRESRKNRSRPKPKPTPEAQLLTSRNSLHFRRHRSKGIPTSMEMRAVALENQQDPDEKWEDLHFDLGPCPGRCCACCCGLTIDFKDDHITLKNYECWSFCKNEAEFPYGEISGVTQNRECGCCWGISGLKLPIQPGSPCCCEGELVKAFVQEVKKRTRAKGDAAQLKATYSVQDDVKMIVNQVGLLNGKLDSQEKKLDAIIAHMRVELKDMA